MDRSEQITWNPFTPGYFGNPYPHLRECRENNPIHIGGHNAWVFFKYEDVSTILRSKDFLSSDLSGYLYAKEDYIFKDSDQCPYLSNTTKLWPMYLEGEIHKSLRVVMMKAFNQIGFKQIIADSTDIVNALYANLREFDLAEYCARFIYEVVVRAFDISSIGFEDMHKYSNHLAISQDIFIPKQIYQNANRWMVWGKSKFEKSKYRDLIIEQLRDYEIDCNSDEIYSIMAITILAAYETSKDNLSVALSTLIQDKKLIDYVLNISDSQQNILIEELFRFTCPLQFTIRVNKYPLQINDIKIESESKLYLSLASANRDPKQFKNPDDIVPDRYPNDHLSFGGGSHFCLGSNIARMELRTCLKPMMNFLKNYELNNETIHWKKQVFMRNLQTAIVTRR